MSVSRLPSIMAAAITLGAAAVHTADAQSQQDRNRQWQEWNQQMLRDNAARRNQQLIEEARRAQALEQARRAASEARARELQAAQLRAEQTRQEQRRQEIRQQEQLRQAQQRQRGR